jgi:hypothetical protein
MSEGRVSNTDLANWREFLGTRDLDKEECFLVMRLFDWLERWTDKPSYILQRVMDKACDKFGWKTPPNDSGE